MIRYEELNLHIDFGRLLHLVSAHAKEMYEDKSNLDVSHMSAVIAAGLARSYVVYDDKEIVGYTLFLLSRDIFQAHEKIAECIAVFVQPAHRNGVVASRLLAFSAMRLGADGVNKLIVTANNSVRMVKFYTRLGFEQCNIQLVKEI